MAKKISVLKPWTSRNFQIFLSFCYYNSEDAVTYFDKDMFKKKNLDVVQTITVKSKPHLLKCHYLL